MDIPHSHRIHLKATFQCAFDISILSPDEQDIIVKYGAWLHALMCEHIAPFTDAQRQFIRVCKGQSSPETPVERAWYRYRIECLYRSALKAEKDAGATSYKEIRGRFAQLARLGHTGAIAWMQKEGPWKELPSREQKGYAGSTAFNRPYKLLWPVSGSFGSKYDYGQGPVDVPT